MEKVRLWCGQPSENRTRNGIMELLVLFTGSIARSASRRYLIYSEAHFDVFRPAGVTCCTDGFHPHRCNDKGVGPQKLKILLRFHQNMEYKRPAGAYPLRDFHKICRVCTSYQDALGVKIRWTCSRGYGVIGVLS